MPMKRRQFIQKSVWTAVGLTLPLSKIYAQKLGTFDTFSGTLSPEKSKEEISFEIVLFNYLNTKFETIPSENKIIKFSAYKKVEGGIKTFKADLRATSIKKEEQSQGQKDAIYKIETTLLQTNSSEFELAKELNLKKMTLLYQPDSNMGSSKEDAVLILDKKNKPYLKLSFKEKTEDEGCFLTTACVHTLGKSDDCKELSILRKFRDEHLKTSSAGQQLVEEYYEIAPKIVQALAIRNDKQMVYTNIYNQMILPTLDCIAKDNKKNAIRIYRNYTLKLKAQYL